MSSNACLVQVCAALWKWCINDETLVTNLGDWCLTGYGLQQMHPDMVYNNVSRPSDYMLTHFLLFSQVSQRPSFVRMHHIE